MNGVAHGVHGDGRLSRRDLWDPEAAMPPATRLRDKRQWAGAEMGSDLAFERLPCQPERASLGVPTDRPRLPRVDYAPAERLDPLQRLGDIAHREVGQRERIAGAASAGMDADRGGSQVRLPALSLSISASLQLNAEELDPEAPGALGIVCGKLDE